MDNADSPLESSYESLCYWDWRKSQPLNWLVTYTVIWIDSITGAAREQNVKDITYFFALKISEMLLLDLLQLGIFHSPITLLSKISEWWRFNKKSQAASVHGMEPRYLLDIVLSSQLPGSRAGTFFRPSNRLSLSHSALISRIWHLGSYKLNIKKFLIKRMLNVLHQILMTERENGVE